MSLIPFGLKYLPKPGPDDFMSLEVPSDASPIMTHRNLDLLKSLVPTERAVIMEIGICQYPSWESSSKVLIGSMHRDSVYTGVDIEPRFYLKEMFPEKNVTVVQADSALAVIFPLALDLLFIDGAHTPQGVIADWRFSRMVKAGGVVVLHDSTWHSGPRLLYNAVDERLFEKQLHFDGMKDDFGMAVLRRKDA